MLRSNLHGKVMDIPANNEEPGTPIVLLEEHGGTNQKWKIVPLRAWEDYELMMSNPTPLTKAAFWRKLVDDHFADVVGCSIGEYKAIVKRCVAIINGCADQLEKVNTDTGITKVVGESTGIVGGVLGIAGLILAPFTAGASLGLTIAGAVTGAVGGATSIAGTVIENQWDEKEQKRVQEAITPAMTSTYLFSWLMNEYLTSIKEANIYLETEAGQIEARDAYTMYEKAKDVKDVLKNTIAVGTSIYKGIAGVKAAKEITTLVNFIHADWYALNGAKIGLASHAAATGKVAGKVVFTAGSTSAKALSGIFGVVGVGFGIWGVIGAAGQLQEEDELASSFRNSSNELEINAKKMIEIYTELQQA